MAETCDKAFGRYLRTLRDRRGLTLDAVVSLSQTFPDIIHKGYLSRCENGFQKPAFSKIIALSRIYEVPADVLVERMELDMELDRVGGPDTSGLSFDSLFERGRRSLQTGFRWDGYGYLRDAVVFAAAAHLRPAFRDMAEQIAIAHQNVGTAARALGRIRYALHEFVYVEQTCSLGPSFHALILERIACCYRSMKELTLAQKYAQLALERSSMSDDQKWSGHIFNTTALVALGQNDLDTATTYLKKAHDAHRRFGNETERSLTLINLSECYLQSGRIGAARRTCDAALRIARDQKQRRNEAMALILQGEIVSSSQPRDSAKLLWRQANVIARELRDRELRFKAEFALYRLAVRDQDHPVIRSIERRLVRLSPWLPKGTEEVQEFRAMALTRI